MKTFINFSIIFIFSLFLVSTILGDTEKKTVKYIIDHPEIWDKSIYIETAGFIIHYEPETDKTTSYYLLKGYYGDTLRVNTAGEKPIINQEYRVWGILYKFRRSVKDQAYYFPLLSDLFSPNRKEIYYPMLSEKGKECISCQPIGSINSGSDKVKDPIPVYAYLLAGVIVLMAGSFAFVKVRNRNNHKPSDWETPTLTTDYSKIPKTETPPPYYPTQPDKDFKTVKINTTPSKTMRLIPGRLEIINGEDKGKTFLIQGYPTKEGSIVTVGRETVSGERSHSHIQIDQRYQTVSRKQAEIIYKDRKLFVRNLSETNITEVDGQELRLGETVQIRPESIIKMGEIEFQYKV